MAVVALEGFDHHDLAGLETKGWVAYSLYGITPYTKISTGRINGNCLTVAPVIGDWVGWKKPLPSTYASVIVGVAIKLDSTYFEAAYHEVRLLDGSGNVVCAMRFNASMQPYIVDSSSSTLATSSATHGSGTWVFYELKAYVNGASGTVELKANGASIIASTTVNIGSSNIGSVQFRVDGRSIGKELQLNVDDMYVIDTGTSPNTTFLGDCHIQTLYPSADGNGVDWTPNSGSAHYSRVNEHPADGDTSYVSSSTVNHIDSYATDDLAAATATVYAVQVNLYAKKDTSGTREIKSLVRQSSTNYPHATTHALSTSYATYSDLMEKDGAAADWTVSSFNAAEFGVKLVT